jgi:hypothetical protein
MTRLKFLLSYWRFIAKLYLACLLLSLADKLLPDLSSGVVILRGEGTCEHGNSTF